MNEFEQFGGYAIDNARNNSVIEDEFSQFGGHAINTNTSPKEYSLGNRTASAGKAITAGALGSIPDTAALAYNIPASLHNALARHNQNLPDEVKQAYEELIAYNPDYAGYLNTTELPTIPSATEGIDQGIDKLTGGYTETPEDQKYLNEGLKYGASFATGGGIVKAGGMLGNKAISNAGNFMGSLEKSQIAGAGAAGATTSYLADQGASVPESIGGGIAANLAVNATPGLAKGGGNLLAKGSLTLAGLGKNKLNLEAAKAAQDLDIALPKAAASEGKIIALADQVLSKAPISGSVMQGRYLKVANKVMKELDNAYDSVIPAKDLIEVDKRIKQLYDNADAILPPNAKVVPTNTINTIQEIKQKIKTFSPSEDEKKLLSKLTEIEQNIAPSGINRIPAETSYLTGTKRSLNDSINWELKEKGAKQFLKQVQRSLKTDIAEYGKTNPEWYQYFSNADNLYGKVARRKELEQIFSSVENKATGELSYNNLSKILNDNDTKEELKRLVKPEVFQRIEKLATVSRAMAVKNKNLPNPSGTASTLATMNIVGGLVGVGSISSGVAVPQLALYATLAPTLAHFLTDKKSLDLAIKFAEKPTSTNAILFSRQMKKITGYTPVTLLRGIQSQEQEKQSKNNNQIVIDGSTMNYYKNHLEENKKRPKGQALKEILNNPSVVKGAEFLSGKQLSE